MVTLAQQNQWQIQSENGEIIAVRKYNKAMSAEDVRDDLITYQHFDRTIKVVEELTDWSSTNS